ncbi:MAG: sigma-70 family RNA polymerase sigma factor [Candidatus Zixiibacteriota bacterium]|nr:MAG: sigma-70 family RNA polymerase sigma factor [candidate division Zixibacteria bacterium]
MEDYKQQVKAVLAGNTGAFAAIVDGHKRLVGQIVFRLAPCEADREDLCQDIFLKVYQNLGRFRFKSKLSTWIARVAYNTCLNYIEKKRAVLYEDYAGERDTIDDCAAAGVSPHDWTMSRQASVRLCTEIDRLPPVYGLILSLYHLQDMSYAEIGQTMNLPDGTVKSYLFRARRMLRERLTTLQSAEGVCA